ncbi:MAG: efflux transporter periplasmic adaptor subunit [Caulobacteraceae bacterium]|nr:efflux transporter periplasmic adaptor subunit [Caulobacteraceae bacterium]
MSILMDRAIVTPWWRRRVVQAVAGIVVGGALLAGLAAVALSDLHPTLRVQASSVALGAAAPGLFRDFTPLRATVEPRDLIVLTAQEGGQVDKVLARSGDLVTSGQPLVRFRNPELEMSFLDRQNQVAGSISGLEASVEALEAARLGDERDAAKAQFDLDQLHDQWQRQDNLYALGVSTRVALDQARAQYDLAMKMRPLQAETAQRQEALRQRRLPEIQAEIAALRQGLDFTRAKLASLTLTAPMAGRLSDFALTPGERRASGEKVGMLTPQSGFKLKANIDQYYLGRVQLGQPAVLTLAGADQEIAAKVSRIDPQLRDGAFQIELDFDHEPAGLLNGQTLEGRLSLGGDKPALIVPAGQWLDVTGGDWAMVLGADGAEAERRRIHVGRRNVQQVEVLSGLKAGEKIITSSYEAFDRIERVQLSR